MKKAILILLVLLLLLFSPVQATTITFANPTDMGERDLLGYFPNGTLFGTYNLTSSIELPADTDVYFVAKAHTINPVTDPGDWMTSTLTYLQSNVTGLIVAISLLAVLGSTVFGRR